MGWKASRILYLLFLGVLIFAAVPAFSQQCALCYTQAAAAGKRMIEALRSGILVLVVPPTLASVGMIFVVHRKSNQVRRPDDVPRSDLGW